MTDTPDAHGASSAPTRHRWIVEAGWALGAAVLATALAAWALRISFSTLGQRWTVGGDDQILHYTLFTSATQAFPFTTNDNLGFPRGLNAFFTTQFDLASALTVGALGWVIRDGIVLLNVFYLLTFAGAAVTGYLFLRTLHVRPWVSSLVAVIFSLAPYHFLRVGAGHALLANCWAVPLIGVLVLVAAGARTDPFRAWAGRAATVRARRWRRLLPIVGLAVAIASSGGYYYVFAVLVVGGVWLFAALTHRLEGRSWRGLVWPTAAVLVLGAVVATELLVLSLGYGERDAPYFQGRSAAESELYGGRLLPLVLPWSGTGLPGMIRLTNSYLGAAVTSTTTEPPGVPFVASLALAGLMAALFVAVLGGARLRTTAAGRLADDVRVRVLAVATLWAVAFYAVTGLGMAVALVAGPTIRAWARLSILITLFALGLVALVLDRLPDRFRLNRLVPIAVAAIALLDQVVGVHRAVPLAPTDGAEMRAFVAAADDRLADGCGVVQLPLKSFPDSGRIGAMNDYDEALPFLATPAGDLRWSYGSVAGTRGWDVWASVSDPTTFAAAVRSSGACAVVVDTAAYDADPEGEEGWRADVAGVSTEAAPSVTSSSGRFLLFDVPG